MSAHALHVGVVGLAGLGAGLALGLVPSSPFPLGHVALAGFLAVCAVMAWTSATPPPKPPAVVLPPCVGSALRLSYARAVMRDDSRAAAELAEAMAILGVNGQQGVDHAA